METGSVSVVAVQSGMVGLLSAHPAPAGLVSTKLMIAIINGSHGSENPSQPA